MKKRENQELNAENMTVEKKDLGRKARQIIFSTNAVIFTAVVLVVFVLLNIVIEQIPLNLDLTEEKLYTLTETSEKVLDELEEKVEIYALYDRVSGESDSDKSSVIKVLDLYNNHRNIDVSYVDISKKPAFVKNLVGENNAADYSSGDYIVKCGDKTRKIDSSDMYITYEQQVYYFYTQKTTTGLAVETKVTGAIVRVTSEVPKIYWSVDFGEAVVNDAEYSTFVNNIEDSNYDIVPLNLKTQDIPADASVIFFVRPTADLDDKTVDKLEYWFDRGGNAFFFMDPKDSKGNFINVNFTNFNKVLLRFGLKINDDFVEEGEDYRSNTKDEEDSYFLMSTLSAGSLENEESYKLYCFNTRSVSLLTTLNSSYYETASLLETSDEATSIILSDGKTGTAGKKIVAASSTCVAGHKESKAVLFGSSANLQSLQVSWGGNAGIKLVKDNLNWMNLNSVENPGDSIDAKYLNSVVKTIVDATESEQKVLAIIIAIAVPLVVFVAGFIVWLRRRHL
ncbi:MAG: hypothetical protein E7384_06010 [Ruminococcaceae bacterium]|nr:hypothetical protein [Oscillospiraceae bacterium]